MAAPMDTTEKLESFTCSICLEVLEDPVNIPCGNHHVFCKACVDPLLSETDPKCILCRCGFNPRRVRANRPLERQMRTIKIECYGCKSQFLVSCLRNHFKVCDRIDRRIPAFKPVMETTQRIPSNVPNRSTFQCPYCAIKNLTSTDLLQHCNEQHSRDRTTVVCPICSAMPWGDEHQNSSNFLSHLNLRHNFEYDTYVEFEQDDESMLQAAIHASLDDC